MNLKLKQVRNGFTQIINENRQAMTVEVPGDASDPWSVTTNTEFTGRISHESSRQAPELSETPAGISTDLQRFLQVEHTVDFLEAGQIITDQNSDKWKLGPVDPLVKFGGVHGYQAPLTEAT